MRVSDSSALSAIPAAPSSARPEAIQVKPTGLSALAGDSNSAAANFELQGSQPVSIENIQLEQNAEPTGGGAAGSGLQANNNATKSTASVIKRNRA